MGKMKELLIEDWERESEKDSLYMLEKEMEMQWEYEEYLKSREKATITVGEPVNNITFKKGKIKLPRYVNEYKHNRIRSSITESSGPQSYIYSGESGEYQLPF